MAKAPKKQPKKSPKKTAPKESKSGKPFAQLPPSLSIPKVGRPTEYHPAYCEDVIALGAAGKSRAQIAAALGVSRQTMYNWEKAHPEFLDSCNASHDLALAWWETAGQQNMTRQGFNAAAFIFQMKNRFRADGYADRVDNTHANPDGTPMGNSDEVNKIDLARRLLHLVATAAAEKKEA